MAPARVKGSHGVRAWRVRGTCMARMAKWSPVPQFTGSAVNGPAVQPCGHRSRGYQPRACHSGRCGRSAPSDVSLPCPG